MAKNYVQDGNVLDWTNSTGAAVSSGGIVAIGAMIGVALVDIADGASGSVQVEGVFELPKVSADTIAVGDKVAYIAASGEIGANPGTPAAGDVTNAAVAVEAAGSGETTVKVKLTPGTGTAN